MKHPLWRTLVCFFLSFFNLCLRIFFIALRERDRQTDRHQYEKETSTYMHSMGNQICILGVCPDQGSNLQPFGFRSNALTNRAALASTASVCFKGSPSFPQSEHRKVKVKVIDNGTCRYLENLSFAP